MTPELLKVYSREAAALLASRGVDAATVRLMRAMIEVSRDPSKQLWIARQVSHRLRAETPAAQYPSLASELLERTGLSPDFFLSHQAAEIVGVLLAGRATTAFQEQVLRTCVEGSHLGGDLLAHAQQILAKRLSYRARRAEMRYGPAAAARE